MPDLADLYPGYQSHWVDTSAGKLFARSGGKGPPLLLLHGFAQTNVIWHRVAPALAPHFSLVIADLPGYGWSAVPESGEDHAPYDKRSPMGNRDGRADGKSSATRASAWRAMTAAAASPTGSRLTIRAGWRSSRRSTS